MGEQDDEEHKLQDKDHAQEDILLIELQQQHVDGVSIETGTSTITATEQSVEIAACTTVKNSEEGNAWITEIDVERLENGVDIGGYGNKDKLLQLVLDHHISS